MRTHVLTSGFIDVEQLVEGDAIFLKARQLVAVVVNFQHGAFAFRTGDQIAGKPFIEFEPGKSIHQPRETSFELARCASLFVFQISVEVLWIDAAPRAKGKAFVTANDRDRQDATDKAVWSPLAKIGGQLIFANDKNVFAGFTSVAVGPSFGVIITNVKYAIERFPAAGAGLRTIIKPLPA